MLDKTPQKTRLGPIELEVIHGTIRAAELEIEAAVERTARSPMIRDQHDYRVALFDAKGRKLTGRSYSAIVEPVFQYFGDDIQPGDADASIGDGECDAATAQCAADGHRRAVGRVRDRVLDEVRQRGDQ